MGGLARLMVIVARAVHHAHQRGILHRDLKPANILLDERGEPYVTDFGLAKRVQEDGGLTASGAIVGTPGYMAPEQAAGQRALTTAADVHGLGTILYFLLTGRPPFQGANVVEALLQAREAAPPRPRALNPKADRDLETVCLKCLEKEPARRYGSAGELADDLERWLIGEPIRARPASLRERLAKWARRRPAVAALVVVTAAAVLAGSAGVAGFTYRLGAALDKETRSRQDAEWEKGQADEARRAADEARTKSDASRYALQISQVLADVQNGNPVQALARLAECDPGRRGWEHDYLSAACRRTLRLLATGDRSHSALVVHPDGVQFAYVDDAPGSNVVVRETASSRVLHRIKPAHAVVALSYSADGTRLSGAGWVQLTTWDVRTGQPVVSGAETGQTQVPPTFTPDGRLLLKLIGLTLVVRDAATGQELRRIALPEPHKLATLPVSASGRAATCDGKHVKLWDLAEGRQVAAWEVGEPVLTYLALSGDGRQVAGIRSRPSFDKLGPHVQVWEALSGRPVMTADVPDNAMIDGVAFSPDGRQLGGLGKFEAAVGERGFAKLWESETGREAAALRNVSVFSIRIPGPVFFPDGRGLFLYGNDLRIWAPSGAAPPTLPRGPPPRVGGYAAVAFLPDGRVAGAGQGASGGRGDLILWDAGSSQPPQTFPIVKIHLLTALGVSRDGTRIALTAREHPMLDLGEFDPIQVRDVATGKVLMRVPGQNKELVAVALSPDGTRVVAAGNPPTLFVHDALTGRLLHTLPGHPTAKGPFGDWPKVAVEALAFAPDGRTLASGGRDRAVRLWDTEAAAELRALEGHAQPVVAVGFSADGRRIASGGEPGRDAEPGELKVWDTGTGEPVFDLVGHSGAVRGVAFSPDGRRLASVGHDGTARLWDLETGQLVLTLPAHTRPAVGVAFSPDGRRIATCDRHRTVKVWDATPP
jgi:WD40 repeat protein